MTPTQLFDYLNTLVCKGMSLSVMIWGPPGVGKSSVVSQVADAHGLAFTDLRLGQLAPTDLRGLPVAQDGLSRWFPPSFLPREGRGVLFLDELNMAPPTLQGIAQQLILDRRVGDYVVPDGWFIWAAGNRKEDRASVFSMPAPLANRFIHLDVAADLSSFKDYAIARDVDEQLLAFLAYRPALLHKLSPKHPAWPSPRAWIMAASLHDAGLDIAPAVGAAAAAEFRAFVKLYETLPDLDAVLHGDANALAFPDEPSSRYATTMGLSLRAEDAQQAHAAFCWLGARAGAEWLQLFVSDLARRLRARGQLAVLADLGRRDPAFMKVVQQYHALLRA